MKCQKCNTEHESKYCPECGKEAKKEEQFVNSSDAYCNIGQAPVNSSTEEAPLAMKTIGQKTWFVIVMLIFFSPVGLFCMFKHKHFNKVARIIITVVVVLTAIGYLTSTDPVEEATEIVEEVVEEEPVEEIKEEVIEEPIIEPEVVEEEVIDFDITDYDTGITYDQLARNPDDYTYSLVKFTGEVIQVMEGGEEIQIRLAVNGDYDTILYCGYDPSIVSSRILDGDTITVYGMSVGVVSYNSTIGGTITIPGVLLQQIDL